MKENATNILIGVLLIAVIANSAISVGLYLQVEEVQIGAFENQIADLVFQLNELETELVYFNESVNEEIQDIKADLIELQQTLADLDPEGIATQLADIQRRIDQISTSAPLIHLNYTVTDAISDVLFWDFYLSPPAPEHRYYGSWEIVRRQGEWEPWWADNAQPLAGDFNSTLVVVLTYPGFNGTEALNAVGALAQWGWNSSGGGIADNVNATMSSSIVGNCIEFTFSPYPQELRTDNRIRVEFFTYIAEGMPIGVYTIFFYLRDV